MKFLLVGFGSIGRRHLRNLLTLGERDIVVLRSNHSTLPDDELRDLSIETDLDAALAHKPDAVIIATPTALHLDAATPAAEAGCAILIEKPISHSLERVGALQAAVATTGAPVLVGFQFRFHPTLSKAVDLLAQGAIGKPYSVRVHWGEYLPNWHPWEDYKQGYAARADLGGGVILTLSHPFDYLRWLLGEVDQLWSFTAQSGALDVPVEDCAEIGLRFASGVIGSLHLDYLQRPPSHTLEIVGAEGTLRWDNATAALSIYTAAEEAWHTIDPPQGFDRNHLFLDEMRHFIAVAQKQEAPRCTLADGIAAMRLALAARQSSEDHRCLTF